MNVILTVEEVQAILARVTGQVIDQAGLSPAGRDAVREWRQRRSIGTAEMDEFALAFNEAIGNSLDERTTRMIRTKGGRYVTEAEMAGRKR